MYVSQKHRYALRALFELARRYPQGQVKITEIAAAQAIPARFLEAILNQLRQAGFVESRRGKAGGFWLARRPADLTVGDVMRFMDGEAVPVHCVAGDSTDRCPLHGDCVFLPMWTRVQKAIYDVYDNITFQDLVDEDARRPGRVALAYVI